MLQTLGSPAAEKIAWRALGLLWILLIGFRHEVGCDWEPYQEFYNSMIRTTGENLMPLLFNFDLGFVALNWISAELGLSIYFVNTICGLLMVLGLSTFCRNTSLPWLSWLIATPYFLIVVGMGYSRQAVGAGLLLWALVYLVQGKTRRCLLMVITAATFHKWVLVFAVIGAASQVRWTMRMLIHAAMLVVLMLVGAWVFLNDTMLMILHEINSYKGKVSSGAVPRALISALAALSFLFVLNRRDRKLDHHNVWKWLSFSSIILVPFSGAISTIADRLVVYLIPLQLYVWPSIITLKSTVISQTLLGTIIVLFYGSLLLAWLEYSAHGYCWLPYNNILFL